MRFPLAALALALSLPAIVWQPRPVRAAVPAVVLPGLVAGAPAKAAIAEGQRQARSAGKKIIQAGQTANW